MILYEYKGLDLSLLGGTDSVIIAFNEQGAIGWELVSVLGGIGYFKRSSSNGFSSSSSIQDVDSDSMTIITTSNPAGQEVDLDDSEPPKRRVGRPAKENKNAGLMLAEDTIMPPPESIQ